MILLILSIAFGGELNYSSIANGRASGIQKGIYDAYNSQSGFKISIDDILIAGYPGGNSATALHSKYSSTAIASNWYQTIYNGTYAGTVSKAVIAGLGGIPDPALFMAPSTLSGTEFKVQEIKLAGTKRNPIVYMECKVLGTGKTNISGVITIYDFDKAFRLGEIINPNQITSEEALKKIKEAKDLLDLGIYTEQQFEDIKGKYLQFINH